MKDIIEIDGVKYKRVDETNENEAKVETKKLDPDKFSMKVERRDKGEIGDINIYYDGVLIMWVWGVSGSVAISSDFKGESTTQYLDHQKLLEKFGE